MKKGRVILLNGTSSSGKTTIAKALQEELAVPTMYAALDDLFHQYPERILNPTNEAEAAVLTNLIPCVISGLHRSVAALAQACNNVLVDHVLQEDGWLQECVERWAGLEVLFVGVKCPLEITEEREKQRGDRTIGTARYQFERIHSHGTYDIEVDTSVLDTQACVSKILLGMKDQTAESAFHRLAKEFTVKP